MIVIKLGNGDIGITQTVSPESNEISLMFSQLDDTGRVGELLNEEDVGQPICKIQFDNIDGLDNLINILEKVCIGAIIFTKRCCHKKPIQL